MAYFTVKQIAARWSTSPQAIHNLRHRGQLPPAIRIGKKLLFDVAEIEQFEQSRREPAA